MICFQLRKEQIPGFFVWKICNILALHSQGLSTDQYKTVMRVVEMAILSTDLARWGSWGWEWYWCFNVVDVEHIALYIALYIVLYIALYVNCLIYCPIVVFGLGIVWALLVLILLLSLMLLFPLLLMSYCLVRYSVQFVFFLRRSPLRIKKQTVSLQTTLSSRIREKKLGGNTLL